MPFQIKTKKKKKFTNVHGNYKNLPYKKHILLYNSHPGFTMKRYKETSDSIRSIIQVAIENKKRIRVVGSNWSLSKAQYLNDTLIFTKNIDNKEDLKYKTFIGQKYLIDGTNDKEFLFSQCGNTIEDLNLYCHVQKRSLQTSGASNGQTIAGAIGTGVHGSALHVGSMQDFVVGLHIIKGPKSEDSVYIQAESNEIVTQEFANKIGATLLSDDKIFEAAIMSLGTLGFIHGVIIQTVPRYKLLNRTKNVDISDALAFTKNWKVKGTNLDIQKDLLEKHGDDILKKESRIYEMIPKNLYHVKFYINQHDLKDNIRAEIIYKIRDFKVKGVDQRLLSYNKDINIQKKNRKTILDRLIPSLINQFMPKGGKREEGYLNEIFKKSKNVRGFEFATCVAVNSKDAEKTIKLLMKYFDSPDGQRISAAFSFRFVKKSKATMAFTKFNKNCLIGIDGPYISSKKRFDKFMVYATQAMAKSNIPHSWHWGKVNKLDADLVQKFYGSKYKEWKSIRNKFLSNDTQQLFSSAFTDRVGLTNYSK